MQFQVGDTVRLKLLPNGPSGIVEYVQPRYTNGVGVRWPNGNRYPYEPDELEPLDRPDPARNEASGESGKES